MSAKNNTWIDGLLNLVFLNEDFTGLGDSGGLLGSVLPGKLYLSLHTATPGAGGNQQTNEADYTGYNRAEVTRNGDGWTLSDHQISNTGVVSFGACTDGNNTVTHLGIGTTTNAAGKLLWFGQLTAPPAVSAGITPQIAIGALVVGET